jgi:hypothetical protein
MDDALLKSYFVRMCALVEITSDGLLFPDEMMELDDAMADVLSHDAYPLLRGKMGRMLELVNQDPSLIYKDVETELWYII